MKTLTTLPSSLTLVATLIAGSTNVLANEADYTTYTDARSNSLSRSTVASEFGVAALFNNPAGMQFDLNDSSRKKIVGTSVNGGQDDEDDIVEADEESAEVSWHTLAFVSSNETFTYGIGVTTGMQPRYETWHRHNTDVERRELSVTQFSLASAKKIGDTKIGIGYHILEATYGDKLSALKESGYSLGVQHNAINEYTDLLDMSVNITLDLAASYHTEVYTDGVPVGYQEDFMTLKAGESNWGASLGFSFLTGMVSSKLNIMAQVTDSTASFVQGQYMEFSAKRFGLEYSLFNAFGETDLQLRAGRQVYSESSNEPSSSFGFGLQSQSLAFDVAFFDVLNNRNRQMTASISYLF